MDIKRYIEEGKKKGADLSWLEQPAQAAGSQGVTSPQGATALSPGAQQLMDAVSRAQGPVNIPFAPGTPTLSGRQFEYGKERDLIADERYQEQWDYQKQQDAIRNSLARAGASADKSTKSAEFDPRKEADYYKPMIENMLKLIPSETAGGIGIEPQIKTPQQIIQERQLLIIDYLENLDKSGVPIEVIQELATFYGIPLSGTSAPSSTEPAPARQRDIIMEQFRPGSLRLPTLRGL